LFSSLYLIIKLKKPFRFQEARLWLCKWNTRSTNNLSTDHLDVA